MSSGTTEHPAKFSAPILETIAGLPFARQRGSLVLDPFAGTGRVHQLRLNGLVTVGVELEPEWAEMSPYTIVGNALQLPFADATFDAVVTSPCYGNRMADHHNARDGSRRLTYRHTLGRELHPLNSGQLQWGVAYRNFHHVAWREVRRVLKPGGHLVLNVSNHIRRGDEQRVSEWHAGCLEWLGFRVEHWERVPTRRMRYGEHAGQRVAWENVIDMVRTYA